MGPEAPSPALNPPAKTLSQGDITVILLVVATSAFGYAAHWSHITYDTGAFRLIAVASLALLAALVLLGTPITTQTYAVLAAAIAAALVAQFVAFLSLPPVFYPSPEADRTPYHVGQTLMILGLAALALSFVRNNQQLTLARNILLYGGFLVTGAFILTLSPDPAIDVYRLHRQAATDLLSGTSPYTLSQPVQDSYMTWLHWSAYPYPPVPLLAQVPAHALLQETRWTNLIAMAATAFMITRIARHAGLPGTVSDAIGALVLFQPRTFFILEQAWTEPISAALLVGAVHAYVRNQLTLSSILFGFAAVSKQYMVVLAPLLLFLPKFRKKEILIAAAAAAATLLPFLLWNAQGFWHGVVDSQLDTPVRLAASNSIAAFLQREHEIEVATWVGFTLWILVPLAASLWRRTIPLAPIAAFTVSLALLFNFGKQAFPNYYWLLAALSGLLIALLPAFARREPEPWIIRLLQRHEPSQPATTTPAEHNAD